MAGSAPSIAFTNLSNIFYEISNINHPGPCGHRSLQPGHRAGGTVYVSGQLPIDPATGAFAEGGIKELTRQSLTNIKHILEQAGLTMGNVVKTSVFLADMNDFAEMNEVYAQFFEAPSPHARLWLSRHCPKMPASK